LNFENNRQEDVLVEIGPTRIIDYNFPAKNGGRLSAVDLRLTLQ